MTGSTLPRIAFALFAGGACLLGLTTYTSPVIGPLRDDRVAGLLHRALGDPAVTLPAPPRELPIQPRSSLTIGPEAPAEPAPASDSGAALSRWATRSAAADSTALRAWLDRRSFLRTVTRGDTVVTILLRLTLRRGCPLASHLWIREDVRHDRLLGLRSDCPALAEQPAGS